MVLVFPVAPNHRLEFQSTPFEDIMPLTVNVGLSKEFIEPEGSLGVSCNVEVEIDVASLKDVDDFDRTVEQAFFVCREAVDGEIKRHDGGGNSNSSLASCNRCVCREAG
jgi:hypothetical protein